MHLLVILQGGQRTLVPGQRGDHTHRVGGIRPHQAHVARWHLLLATTRTHCPEERQHGKRSAHRFLGRQPGGWLAFTLHPPAAGAKASGPP